MRKQTIIVVVSATVLVALLFATIAFGEQANATGNNTASDNTNSTKNTNIDTTKSMANATTTAAKNSTGPVVGYAGGSIGGAKAVSPSK